MFFKLAHAIDDRFPSHHHLGRVVLNVDQGWQSHRQDHLLYIFKGYVEDSAWCSELLVTMSDLEMLGNFCVFCFDYQSGKISLLTNRWRGLIIYSQPGQWISNLDIGSHTIWNDSSIIIDQNLSFAEKTLDIIGDTSTVDIPRSRLIKEVTDILDSRVSNFLKHNTLPLKVFCSGGIDSTLVWSFIKRHSQDYEMILGNHIQWDYFWCKNQRQITQQFWGYKQIHHWVQSCVLSSGAFGDAFFFRSPSTVNIWCMYNDIDIFDYLKPGIGMCYSYFTIKKHQELFRTQQRDRSLDAVMKKNQKDFNRYLCNIAVNDCQHWHLGNTLTFTPLRDLEIFKLFLNLSVDDLLPQIFDGEISRSIISQNDQSMLDLIADIKDSGEELAKLASLVPR
jgi:hypothetical protein